MKKLICFGFLMISLTSIFAQEWPSLDENLQESMTVDTLIEYLQSNDPGKVSEDGGYSALVYSMDYGSSLEVIQYLIQSGIDIDQLLNDGMLTALMVAVAYRSEVVPILLDAGAEVNLPNDSGITPLMFALMEGQIESINILIENGADIKAVDSNGKTALLHAIENEEWEAAESLVSYIVENEVYRETPIIGVYFNMDDGIYESFEIKNTRTCIVTDGIFGFNIPTTYVREKGEIRITGDKNGDIILSIIDRNMLMGEGAAEGLYIKE